MLSPVLVKVTFYDEAAGKTNKAVHILQSYSYAEAARQLEEYYGDSIEKVHMTMYESGLITFPVEMYKKIEDILGGNV